MQQVQLLRPERVRSKFKVAFWGRDSITTATLLNLAVFLLGFIAVGWIVPRLFDQYLTISPFVIMVMYFLLFGAPSMLANAITARLSPKWCLVPWAAFNVAVFILRILPELQSMVGNGDWKQFWQLLIPYVLSFLVQTFVLLKVRRRTLSGLSVKRLVL
jgi:hypothetical protein